MLKASGSGNTDEVVFTMRLDADMAATRRGMDSLRREYESFRRDMERPIMLGGAMGGVPRTGGASSGGGIHSAGSFAGSPRIQSVMRDAAELEKQGLTDMAGRYRTVAGSVADSMAARAGASAAERAGWIRRQNDYWQNDPSMRGMQGYVAGNWHGGRGDDDNAMGKLNNNARQAISSITELTRAFVLFGVSGEENIAKVVKTLATLEAASSGIRAVMGLGKLAGAGGLASGVVGGAALLGIGAFSLMNRSYQQSRDAINARVAEEQAARTAGFRAEYEAGLSADRIAGSLDQFHAGRSDRRMYAAGAMGRDGNLDGLRGRLGDVQSSLRLGEAGFGNLTSPERMIEARREELELIKQIASIEERKGQEALDYARYATSEYEKQLAIEQRRLQQAQGKAIDSQTAYGALSPEDRNRFNAAAEAHMSGETLSDRQVRVLGMVDPEAAREAMFRRGADYSQTAHGKAQAANIAKISGDIGFIQGEMGQPGGSKGAYGDIANAENALAGIRERANRRVDEITKLIFDLMDRVAEQIEQKQMQREAQKQLAFGGHQET